MGGQGLNYQIEVDFKSREVNKQTAEFGNGFHKKAVDGQAVTTMQPKHCAPEAHLVVHCAVTREVVSSRLRPEVPSHNSLNVDNSVGHKGTHALFEKE